MIYKRCEKEYKRSKGPVRKVSAKRTLRKEPSRLNAWKEVYAFATYDPTRGAAYRALAD